MTILNFGSPGQGADRTNSEFGWLPREDERGIIAGGMAAIILVALLCAMATHPPVVHSQTWSAGARPEPFTNVGDSSYDDLHRGIEEDSLYRIREAALTVSWGDLGEQEAFGRWALLALEEFQQRQDRYSAGSMAAACQRGSPWD